MLVGEDETLLVDDEARSGVIGADRPVEAGPVAVERQPAHQPAVLQPDNGGQDVIADLDHFLEDLPSAAAVVELPLIVDIDGGFAEPLDVGGL